MEPQPWLDFKAEIVRSGKTQDDIARLVGASRPAIRRAVLGKGCPKVRRKLLKKKLLVA